MAEDVGLSKADFSRAWRDQREDTSFRVSEVAWRRYQQIQAADYETIPESSEPNFQQFQSKLNPLLESPNISSMVASYKFVSVPSNTMPWKATGISLHAGSLVSTFATGRLWRSRLLDLFLPPQFSLYFRVGVNGLIFNPTRDTNTFDTSAAGELYLAPQFPGQFGNPQGGRVQGSLKAFDLAVHSGAFQVLVVVWKDNTTRGQVSEALRLSKDYYGDCYGLVKQESERLVDDHQTERFPKDWQNLWFLGDNEVYSQCDFDGHKGIRCCPDRNVGILQKHFEPAVPFTKGLTVSWDWYITALPSRLREDTSISHDYFSVAFEFENGRDLTYTWSWELAKEYGYWCPLTTWEDREYHIVIRSGTEELGKWLGEKRDLYADYTKFIGRINVPSQIVRVWLIAGNRWQRYKGEMLVKNIAVGDVQVL